MSTSELPAAQPGPATATSTTGSAPPLRWIESIWRIRGHIDLPAGHSASTAYDLLKPLFETPGTTHDHASDGLSFSKKDPPAQDRLAVFDGGRLTIAETESGPVLRYDLMSRFLLACFLAPFLFLAFGQLSIAAAEYQKAKSEASKGEKKEKDKEKPEIVLNPFDIVLGAPAPKTRKQMKAEKEEKEKEPPSALPANIFAGIFAFLYVLGRILEERLVRSLFRKQFLP